MICWSLPQLVDALDKLPTATPTADLTVPQKRQGWTHPSSRQPEQLRLNELIFRKAQGGQTEFGEQRATALAAGLSEVEVDATIQERQRSGDE